MARERGEWWSGGAWGGAVAPVFIIRAYAMAGAGAMAPFGYLDMVFATVWSIAAFGEYPDRFSLSDRKSVV